MATAISRLLKMGKIFATRSHCLLSPIRFSSLAAAAVAVPLLVPPPFDKLSLAVAEKVPPTPGGVEDGGEQAVRRAGKGPRRSNNNSSRDCARRESLRGPVERLAAAGMDEDKLWPVVARRRSPEKWLAKLELLLQRGLSPSQVDGFFGSGDVYITGRKLTSILDILDSLDPCPPPPPSQTLAGKLLVRFPSVVNISVKTMEDRIKYLVDQGFDAARIRGMLLRSPTLLGLSVQGFRNHILFFERLGLTREQTVKVLHRCPYLFSRSIEKTLMPFFDSLEERGLVKEDALKLLVRTPCAVQHSAAAISERLKFLQEKLGLEEKSRPLTKALFVLSSYSIPLLEERVDWFLSQGVTEPELRAMLRTNPDVIASPTKKVVTIAEYIKRYLDFDLGALIRVPIIFLLSPEKRILPRCQVIAGIKESKLLKKKVMLRSTFLTTDEGFGKYVLSLAR